MAFTGQTRVAKLPGVPIELQLAFPQAHTRSPLTHKINDILRFSNVRDLLLKDT
jgi:hypothetical protein